MIKIILQIIKQLIVPVYIKSFHSSIFQKYESITKQCHLTPTEQKIYKKAAILAKQRNRPNNNS